MRRKLILTFIRLRKSSLSPKRLLLSFFHMKTPLNLKSFLKKILNFSFIQQWLSEMVIKFFLDSLIILIIVKIFWIAYNNKQGIIIGFCSALFDKLFHFSTVETHKFLLIYKCILPEIHWRSLQIELKIIICY